MCVHLIFLYLAAPATFNMVLSSQTQRNWKLFTGLACAVSGFHGVFRIDYGPQEHIFSGVSSAARSVKS